jgi:sugar phosphate isomerase/epimerase
MSLIDRIGIAIGITHSVEDGLRWAATHGLRYVDFRLETGPEAFDAFTPARYAALRTQAENAGIPMGLHTLSAVNIAEYAPYLAEAADQYLRTYIDIAKALNAGWVDVHAGSHVTSDVTQRKAAGLERLKRAVGYAEAQGVLVLLENLNWEPDHAKSIISPIRWQSASTLSMRLTLRTCAGP